MTIKEIINKLKALKDNYHFEKFKDSQLAKILDKIIIKRRRLCEEIEKVCIYIDRIEGHDFITLFNSNLSNEELENLKEAALKIKEKKDLKDEVIWFSDKLGVDYVKTYKKVLNREPNTIEDYK